ncbi:MAG: hypothetical protein HW405_151 [Candidatus Berkelbacteria bacterium]|nr:hypothetical protein [Candidatus Berkelbacteria bacterium]
MNYIGTIIEESLEDKSILENVKILSTKVEDVTEKHQTPWLEKWTLDKVEVEESKVDEVSQKISESIDESHDHPWYADYKNKDWHYIIFPHKIFKIARADASGYAAAKRYGISLGIPEYQVDFSPDIK